MDLVTDREAQARREIGETLVARPVAWVVVVLVLATAGFGALVDLTALEDHPVVDVGYRARAAFSGRRAMLREIERFEDDLEESSALSRVLRPPTQRFLSHSLGVGTEKVWVGLDGWLYFRPDVDYLTGLPFLDPAALEARRRGGPVWEASPQPDPRVAILDLHRRLESRGIALVVVPTPIKPSLHPEMLVASAHQDRLPLQNPSFAPFLRDLQAAGVAVVDPAPTLAARREEDPGPQYLATDTHWTPGAMEAVAEVLALRIGTLLPAAPSKEAMEPAGAVSPEAFYRRKPLDVEGSGDLEQILASAQGASGRVATEVTVPAEVPVPADRTDLLNQGLDLVPADRTGGATAGADQVTVQQVVDGEGRLWQPRRGAEVLLLGDSFTNVFSQEELGWGRGAGLGEQLSFYLQRPVDRIAVNAGASSQVRQRLARSGERRLDGTRVVVYQFAVRELAGGDWSPAPFHGGAAVGVALSPGPAAEPESGDGGPSEAPGLLPLPAPVPLDPGPTTPLGEGLVVFESNRRGDFGGGDWRIWRARLDGSGARQLSPDEAGRQHCCPHISPDGRTVVYLSRAVGRDRYPEVEAPGELRAHDLASGNESVLVEAARSYGWGNRSAVWRDDGDLVYIGGEGRTYLLNPGTGESRALTTAPRAELGWLLDPKLRYATHAAPSFSPYDPEAEQVLQRRIFGGCEPYFSSDGRWGYWIAGAGGPLNRIDLASREVSTILRKNDPRLGTAKGYMYYPMVSRDRTLLSFGASDGEHDHFKADYDIFSVPVDPRTLEVLGPALQLTDHPATDRYPDLYRPPLALGRHQGEAPLTVRFPRPPGGGAWDWSFGDGAGLRGEAATAEPNHTYQQPGAYPVEARRGATAFQGQVTVTPARPPQVTITALRGSKIVVRFDEPIAVEQARARLASGKALAGLVLGEDGRSLEVELAAILEQPDTLHLSGVADAAQSPNTLAPQALEISPTGWPADRRSLVFLWQTAGRPNLVPAQGTDAERAYPLTAHGQAHVDRDGAMVLADGAYSAPAEANAAILDQIESVNELTLEVTVTPALPSTDGFRPIVTFSRGGRKRNVTLAQEGADLVLRLRTGETGDNGDRPQVTLFPVQPGETVHVAVTYTPGVLSFYRNGEEVRATEEVQGDFFRWKPMFLVFGEEAGGGEDWRGAMEGIALYARALPLAEVAENARRYRRLRNARAEVPRRVLRARLAAASKAPTLDQITPYRQALMTLEWQIEEVLEGKPPEGAGTLRVAHWAILDGETQPAARWRPGEVRQLVLEPFEANPQLEPYFLSDTLPPQPELPLFFAVSGPRP